MSGCVRLRGRRTLHPVARRWVCELCGAVQSDAPDERWFEVIEKPSRSTDDDLLRMAKKHSRWAFLRRQRTYWCAACMERKYGSLPPEGPGTSYWSRT
jgi:hypothetical protein